MDIATIFGFIAASGIIVAHQIMKVGDIDPNRFGVAGYGATKPIASNASREGRNKNRRWDQGYCRYLGRTGLRGSVSVNSNLIE